MGQPIVVGIRPEDLRPVTAGTAMATALQARLEVVEPVGNEVFLNLDGSGTPLVARTPPGALPEVGSVVTLAYDPATLHFFDAETAQRIAV